MFKTAVPEKEMFIVVFTPETVERVAVTVEVPPAVAMEVGEALKVTVGGTFTLVRVKFTELGVPVVPFVTELIDGMTVRSGL